MKRKTRGIGFGAKTDSERKRDKLRRKKEPFNELLAVRTLARRPDNTRREIIGGVTAKYNLTKAVDISKFNRRFVTPPLQAAERPAGEFSPGKNHLDLPDGGISSVADFVAAIQINWQRGVDAFMSIARLCAEASARLTALQKSELIQALPFGETAFSKFVQIGTDTRLYAPDIQRLLPPHYTTTYAVTLLTDQELKQAIAEKVLHPDMKRNQLQRWLNRHRAPRIAGAKEAASNSAVASAPIAPTQDGVESGALPAVSDDNRDNREQLAVAPEDVPPEAVATAAAGPLTLPPSDEDIPAFLDRRPPSAEDQRVFDVIMAAWKIASPVVRERVRAEIIRADASSLSGAD